MNPRSELAYCLEKGITLLPLEKVWEMGPDAVAEKAVSVASNGTNGVYLTLDIDVLDSSFAPGTGVPTTCGMTPREMLGIVKGLGAANIRAFDLVEVSRHGITTASPPGLVSVSFSIPWRQSLKPRRNRREPADSLTLATPANPGFV
jgi:arginase family enzyme